MSRHEATLQQVGEVVPTPTLDVLFLHGLDGDATDTWSAPGTGASFWPRWIAEEFPYTAVWTAGYPIASSRWRGHSMSLADRALNLLAQLEGRGFGDRPIVTVTHSLGGLLAKQLLLAASASQAYRRIADSLVAIAFLATPHDGSRLADYAARISTVFRPTPIMQDLRNSDAHLIFLGDWFRTYATEHNIEVVAFAETLVTHGLMVVEAGSSNPGIAGSRRVPVDANHVDICKPKSREDLVYKQTAAMIRRQHAKVIGSPSVAVQGIKKVAIPLNLNLLPSIRSLETGIKTTIDFHNQTAASLDISWIANSGGLRHMFSLNPGENIEFHTYVAHAWLVSDTQGRPVALFQAEEGPAIAVLAWNT